MDPFVHAQLRQAMGRLEQAAGRRREAIRQLTSPTICSPDCGRPRSSTDVASTWRPAVCGR